jgi:hypothetical protein
MYTKSALDAYARTTQGRVRNRKVRTIAEDAPKRDFVRSMGNGTRSGARRLVQKIPELFSGSERKSRIVEVRSCPVAQKYRRSQTYDSHRDKHRIPHSAQTETGSLAGSPTEPSPSVSGPELLLVLLLIVLRAISKSSH